MSKHIVKYADLQFTREEIHDPDSALINPEVLDRFTKYAKTLKAVAPKAKDFLYFSCVMMHAAEAALIDQKTGEPRLGKDGKPLTAKWDVNSRTGSWKWACSDPDLKPYKNNNGDIFPESELKKAYRLWVEKPLCQDHQSNTVDGMRGLIIDTYWDDKHKRVIALCALDRKNYPDLARKIEGRYATNVSMGTAVGRSICYDCGNVAKTEAEYCQCVRGRRTYGEINIELSPIELSLVVTGADPAAKLRHIIASLNGYAQQKQARIEELQRAGCVTPGELDSLRVDIEALRQQVEAVSKLRAQAAVDPSQGANFRSFLELLKSPDVSKEVKDKANEQLLELLGGQMKPEDLAALETPAAPPAPPAAAKAEDGVEPPYGMAGNKAMTGGLGETYTQDPESSGPPPWSLSGRETRFASGNLEAQIAAVLERLDAMQADLQGIQATANRNSHKEEKDMSDLKERARARRAAFEKNAYHQGGGGVNDPAALPYPKEDEDKIRNTQDKQMVGEGMEPGNDGLAGDDLALKKKLLRAELEQRSLRRHALLSKGEDTHTTKMPDGKEVTFVKGADGKWIQKDDDGIKAKAYHLGGGGVNDPATLPYPKEDSDKIRNTQDKQMVGEGMEMGNDGLAGDDLALKKKLLRAELTANFIKVYADEAKSEVLRDKSRWEVYAGDKKLFQATGEQIYDNADLADDKYWDHLKSADYGRRILAEIRSEGLEKTAYVLTGQRIVTAQEPMLPPPGAPPVPPAPPAEAPKLPMEEPKEEKPGAESTKNAVDEALAEVEKTIGDLKEAINAAGLSEKGGKEELPPVEVEKSASDLSAALDDSGDELAILSEVLGKRIEAGMADGAEMEELMKLAEESLSASVELRREAGLVIEAKKGKMPEGLKKALEEKEGKKGKKPEKEDEEEKEEKGGKKPEKEDKEGKKGKKPEKEDKEEKPKKESKKGKKDENGDEEDEEMKSEAELVLEKMLRARAAKRRELVRLAIGEGKFEEQEQEITEKIEGGVEGIEDLVEELEAVEQEEGKEDEVAYTDDDAAQYADAGEEDPLVAELLAELEGEGSGGEPESEPAEADMSAMASRRAWRERMAAEVGAKYQLKLEPAADMDTDMVPKAHPERSHTLEGLDTKPADEGAMFEGIDAVKAKIMKQVESLPKVREAVAKIGDLLKAGKITAADLSDEAQIRQLAAADAEAVKYWKAYFGEGDPGSKQFGAEMSKEFAQKKASQEAETYRLKLRRAVDLALDMQEKGACAKGREAMNRQVDELMKLSDDGFNAFKKATEYLVNPVKKTAGRNELALQVGLKEEVESVTLSDQLDRLWVPRK
jgi:hypothetical protein